MGGAIIKNQTSLELVLSRKIKWNMMAIFRIMNKKKICTKQMKANIRPPSLSQLNNTRELELKLSNNNSSMQAMSAQASREQRNKRRRQSTVQ